MAKGIAKKKDENERIKKGPSSQTDKTNVCVSSFAETPDRGVIGFKGMAVGKSLKEQIRDGEYKAIKLSDKPLQIEHEEQR